MEKNLNKPEQDCAITDSSASSKLRITLKSRYWGIDDNFTSMFVVHFLKHYDAFVSISGFEITKKKIVKGLDETEYIDYD